jgi:Putative papain-like cysteine peptidase (DUF1796)
MSLLSLTEFTLRPATHVVSLGGSCQASYNLRRYYDFSTAYPFDWWITPLSAVIRLLREFDIEKLYDPTRLKVSDNFDTVFHADYALQLFHEFPRDHKNLFGNGIGRVCPNFCDYLAEPKSRTAYLWERFLGLNQADYRIFFIRQQISPAEASIQDHLVDALQNTFPKPVSTVALVNTPGAKEQNGVCLFDIPQGAPSWHGYTDAWDAALERLGIKLESAWLPLLDKCRPNPDMHATD